MEHAWSAVTVPGQNVGPQLPISEEEAKKGVFHTPLSISKLAQLLLGCKRLILGVMDGILMDFKHSI